MENRIILEGTNFIFTTNFSGDPARDYYHKPERKCCIILPDDMARGMIGDGFNVKETRPRPGMEDGFEPTFFITARINYDYGYPPHIVLVSGDNPPAVLNAENVGVIDTIRVAGVDVVLNVREGERGKTVYVNTMYVVQDLTNDPFAAKYFH